MFKIATWNVNSLKVRLDQVLDWLEDSQTDVLALQETKLEDIAFPREAFEDAGYEVMFRGQKTYNGVAWISRHPMSEVMDGFLDFVDDQKRVLAVTVNDIRLINFYVPNGQSIDSSKYEYKLNWLKSMNDFIHDELKKYPKLAVVGDFNIAPDDIDVYDPKQWFGQVLVSEPERMAFSKLLRQGLIDIVRMKHPQEDNLYSWWDYRDGSFHKGHGMRINLVLTSASVAKRTTSSVIDRNARKGEKPSDHAPVMITVSKK